jgi:hypothetical protein
MVIEAIERDKKVLESQAKDLTQRSAPDLGAKDIFEVRGGLKDKIYRWVNTQKQNLEMKKMRGWTPVSNKDLKTLANVDTSQHVLGDLVLCEMPKEKYDKLKEAQRKLGSQRRKEVGKQFKEEAERLGLKPYSEE